MMQYFFGFVCLGFTLLALHTLSDLTTTPLPRCDPGYQLIQNKCVTTQQTKKLAKEICLQELRNLQLHYKQYECQDNADQNTVQSLDLNKLIVDFGSESSNALTSEMVRWFYSTQNQHKHQFKVDKFEIVPLKKSKPFSCFLGSATILSDLPIAIVFFCRQQRQHSTDSKKATEIYSYLRKEVMDKGEVPIIQSDIESKYGPLTSQIWSNVDQLRNDDSIILFYEQSGNIHWKKLY